MGIFLANQAATILVATALGFWGIADDRSKGARGGFQKELNRFLFDPAKELVLAGKKSGRASGEIARSSASS
jgi:hypothetical protein